ncbi:MAG TPA: TrkA family potassium uptake protein [Anaerolineaceae bacterium]|jgi:trk system potassium uptake protein TrkA
MFVIIVGGGKTGSQLASGLIQEGHRVRIIDDRAEIIERLRIELPSDLVVLGDGSAPDVLEEVGIRDANVLAAVTGDDEANLVVCTLARFEFNVPRVIARVNNPKNAWLFNAEMGVDVAVDQADILAHLIAEEMSLGDMMTLLKLRKGEYSVVEEKVHPTSLASGRRLSELHIPSECIVAAIIRKGKLMIPHGDTVLLPADEILAVAHSSQISALAAVLNHP